MTARSVKRKRRGLLVRLLYVAMAVSLVVHGLPVLPDTASANTGNIGQLDYRWYQNLDGTTPTVSLAAENTAVADISAGTVFHLRMNLDNGSGPINAGTAAYKLQFATSVGGPWTDVGGLGSAATWRGFDNGTPADGATLPSAVLSSSDSGERQSYEEANPTVSNPNRIGSNRQAEWAWVVEANDAQPSTTYFFRMVQDSGTALASYINYPELTVAATPGVTITESAASTDVTEGGAQDTYDVVLDGAPSGTVTITVTPDADVSVSDTTLTFTTGNWATPQTVTVTAVNDAVVEGAHTGTITHSASGGGYDAVSINNVVANVTDNDTASVTVTESGGSTDVTEVGAQDTYDVVLDLEPSGTVTITVSPDSDVTVNTTTLTFTTGNWSTPQTVTVTAVDDAIVEGAHTGTITHSASGGSYDGVSINNVVANITDRPPTVTVTESGGTTDVTEGGTQDTYDVVLDAQPTGAVTITVSPDSDVSVNTTTLVFTTGNWSVAQTVTTTAVDDGVVEGAHTGTVTHSSSGGGYDGVSINSVVANVTDDDAASVTVTESGGSTDVTEGGAQDSYDVVLDLEPSGTVTITLSPEADVYVVKTSGTEWEPLKRATWTLTGSGSSQICQPPFG